MTVMNPLLLEFHVFMQGVKVTCVHIASFCMKDHAEDDRCSGGTLSGRASHLERLRLFCNALPCCGTTPMLDWIYNLSF